MHILHKYIKYNYSKRQGKIEYIVIHDTGNKGKGANANSHYNYFNGGDRQASAHYFVDDKQIIEVVEPTKHRSWHCGDGRGKNGITNDNSIGIEMCVNIDGDFEKTYQNTVELTKELQKKYNIPDNKVVRHQDASGKVCPYSLIKDKLKGKTWETFKRDIKEGETLYRVCIGTYSNIDNARRVAKEKGGFIIEYKK